ncbi:MAG: antibiotic biosynthesis monooxygenase [Deltaproteobacteria bacterium]|nr:antibiotic biosynthesis monooxygenase [Deltaproteobacteria bacterium]
MTVKILIKRKVTADKSSKLQDLIMQLRSLVVKQPGYVSGESLKNIDKPDEYLVISTWNALDAWKKWLASKERADIQEKIDALLGQKTEYEVYEYRP